MSRSLGREMQRREQLEQANDRFRNLAEMIPWETFSESFNPLALGPVHRRVRGYQGLNDLTYNLTRYVAWQKKESCT